MKFSLIICTYQRADAIVALLNSVNEQTLYPDEIIVVDGSTDILTQNALELKHYLNLSYYKVGDTDRGLTKQRNFGIKKLDADSPVVCFLDDDTVFKIL